MSKIWCDLGQLLTLSTNIFGSHRDIDKRITTLMLSALNKKLVDFGPLTKKL